MPIKSRIRTIENYPKEGILFRDITTLFKDPQGLQLTVNTIADRYKDQKIDKIVGIEARGFMIGTPVAYALGAGFVPLRKPGKLPAETISQSYALEYGTDTIEAHQDAIAPNERVLLIDDLLATGGTAEAACLLLKELGAQIVECAVIVELTELGGAQRLQAHGVETFAVVKY
ncbi:adenine phosphoribosyltransferase [Orrella sp. 11846]|uniref:adenine phosphoribosyltransferase n=1 Tax=Orrella sp. 11846 TaxID=3409913 RepID=UPI003B5BB111